MEQVHQTDKVAQVNKVQLNLYKKIQQVLMELQKQQMNNLKLKIVIICSKQNE